MSVEVVNPNSAILQQLEGQWQKMAMLILWKLAGKTKIRITDKDIAQFSRSFSPHGPALYTHGHVDSIEFQIVDKASADRLAAHDATMRGKA